jgi:hydrogenase nickel incorporation protein HypA/HybF
MHELAVTENILKIAVQHATQANAVRVTAVNLVIGQLSSIVDDSVQFYWDMLSEGTLCAGAQLHFERRPANLRCLDCGHTYILAGELTDCPACHSARLKVVGGEEFYLDSIEVEAETLLAPDDTPVQEPDGLSPAGALNGVTS